MQFFAECTHASRLLKSRTQVSGVTNIVVDLGIRPELRTPLANRPLLGTMDECSTDPLTAGFWDNIPALQIGHAIRSAAVDDIAD